MILFLKDFESVLLSDYELDKVITGVPIKATKDSVESLENVLVRLYDKQNKFVGLGETKGNKVFPKRLINTKNIREKRKWRKEILQSLLTWTTEKLLLLISFSKQSGVFRDNETICERVMDSNDLERERGITIVSKNCSIVFDSIHINIVDTPGHADFGGEVERILSMVDGVLLLVDAVEGPMPQTRFVTNKALQIGLRPIVVINKIDKIGARPDWVIDETFELFANLGANDQQLDFPVIYASAIKGFATVNPLVQQKDMKELLSIIVTETPEPSGDVSGPFRMQISAVDYSPYLGKIGIGKISRGVLSLRDNLVSWRERMVLVDN